MEKDLRLWRHPQTDAPRLYLSDAFRSKLPDGLGHRFCKLWFEPVKSAPWGWKLKYTNDARKQFYADADDAGIVMSSLGLPAELQWEDLLIVAGTQEAQAKTKQVPSRTSGATSPRDSEALRLDLASIKMPGPVTIRVDFREPQKITDLLSAHPMITVERESLDLGDIEIEDRNGDRLIIERKRCDDTHTKNDFEASVQVDGRLFDQSERLKMAVNASDRQVIPVFILEGDVYANSKSMLCQQIDGAISFLASIQRVNVLSTYNTNHTAYVIAKLATHFIDGLYAPVSLHKAKPKAIFDQQRYILSSIPGVSTKLAEVLLSHFGSVRRVMCASEAELKALPGFGPKKIQGILQALGE